MCSDFGRAACHIRLEFGILSVCALPALGIASGLLAPLLLCCCPMVANLVVLQASGCSKVLLLLC